MLRRILLLALPFLMSLAAPPSAGATQVWSGRTYRFAKGAFGDPNLPANQDHITPLGWITRGNSQGIYNRATEALYTHNVSPAGTAWATGDAVDYPALRFAPWEVWALANPPGTVGVNAVVHLIAEDIYVDIVFSTWGGLGGAFTYLRGVQPTTAAEATTWGRIKRLYR